MNLRNGREYKTEPNKQIKILADTSKQKISDNVPYIVFQTAKMDIISTHNNKSCYTPYDKLSQNTLLFKKIDKSSFQMTLDWPHQNGNKPILIYLEKLSETENWLLRFYDEENHLFTLQINDKDKPTIKKNKKNPKDWNNEDIDSLAADFTEIFDKPKENKIPTRQNQKISAAFFDQYSYLPATYRIQNIMQTNTTNSLSFPIDWVDSQNHRYHLNATLSRANTYNSWFLTEKNFLTFFYPKYKMEARQYYYNFVAKEPNEHEVLKIWFTPDQTCGELYEVSKGTHSQNLPGKEILNIANKFTKEIPIKTMFLCDVSKISDIPLRLISAISSGKTWYEKNIPGLKLFECKELDTNQMMMTQNMAARQKALKELQELPLTEWYKMLDAGQQKILKEIYDHNISESGPFLKSKITLRELTTTIYQRSIAQKTVTSDLVNLNNLLVEDLDDEEDKNDLDKNLNSTNAWVRIRVSELLINSLFWIKQIEPESNFKMSNGS